MTGSRSKIFDNLSLRVLKVWARNLKVWSKYYKASLLGNIGEPILYLAALGYGLGRFIPEIEGMPYIEFLAPGLVASAAMYSATFECTFGSFTRMTEQKTYDAIIVTPVSIEEVIAGDILWGTTKSLISGLAMVGVMALFGLIDSWMVVLVPLVVILEGLVFSSMAMLATSYSPSYEFFSYYFTLAISPMFLFSGIFFPISSLPEWAGKIAWCLPLTHVVNLTRSLFSGELGWPMLVDLAWLALFSSVLFVLSIQKMRRRLIV